jgi:hypothetical protein
LHWQHGASGSRAHPDEEAKPAWFERHGCPPRPEQLAFSLGAILLGVAATPDEFRATVFCDREHRGDWRVEKLCDDGESTEVAIFIGGDERQRAIRYADREYGEFDEIELEPYRPLSEKSGFPAQDRPSFEMRSVRETVAGWLRSEP